MEDRDHLFTCADVKAAKIFRKSPEEMKIILEELETAPTLQAAIFGGLELTRRRITPHTDTHRHTDTQTHRYTDRHTHTHSCGDTDFGDGLTLPRIIRDQYRIGWINFFSGQRRVKWKEAKKDTP